MFKGTTLRGLLRAYAFATMGTIAGIAAIVSFAPQGCCWCWPLWASGTCAARPATVRFADLGACTAAPSEAI